MKKVALVIAAAGGVLGCSGVARGQGCEPVWSGDVAGSGVAFAQVQAMTRLDPDGAGPLEPVLVIGGRFSRVGQTDASGVAAMINGEWTALGSGLPGLVLDLAAFDEDGDGPLPPSLFAAGTFSGDDFANFARWNGTSWTAVGNPPEPFPRRLKVLDPDGPGPQPRSLYVLGPSSVQRWDGAAWHSVGFVGVPVTDITVFDVDGPDGPVPPELYVAGRQVRRFDGTNWHTLPGQSPAGAGTRAFAIAAFDEDGDGPLPERLFVGGEMTPPSGSTSTTLVRWDGQAWSDVGAGPGGFLGGIAQVTDLSVAPSPGGGPPSLYVGGRFATAGGAPAPHIARWDGSAWHAVAGGEDPGALVNEILFDGAGVNVASGGLVLASAGATGKWERVAPPINGSETFLEGAAFDPDGAGPRRPQLVIAGRFNEVDGVRCRNIAVLDGDRWEPLGGGLEGGPDGMVGEMLVVNGPAPGGMERAIFVSGILATAEESPLAQTVAWDGETWRPVGDVRAQALAVWDPDGAGPQGPVLVAGGLFAQVAGIAASRVAVWDGAGWAPLGSGISGTDVKALAVWDEDGDGPMPARLIAGGSFTAAGGAPALNVAMWDGAAWAAMGDGLSGSVYALAVHDPDGAGPLPPQLFAGGSFTHSGGAEVGRVARWTGTAWEQVGAGFQSSGGAPLVVSLVWADLDGDGPEAPALFASGIFERSGETPVRRAARWDGTAWSDFGGLSAGVRLWAFDADGDGPAAPMLMAGGALEEAGGVEVRGLARYGSPAPVLVGGPAAVSVRRSHSVEIPLAVLGAGPLEAAWSRGGVPLVDGATPEGSVFSGAGTAVLRIDNVQVSDAGVLGFAASNACGALEEPVAAVLAIECLADWNADGMVNSSDISAFLGTWLESVSQGHRGADVDASGATASSDISAFLTLWLEGVQGGC